MFPLFRCSLFRSTLYQISLELRSPLYNETSLLQHSRNRFYCLENRMLRYAFLRVEKIFSCSIFCSLLAINALFVLFILINLAWAYSLIGYKEGSKVYKFCLKVKLFFQQGNIQFWGMFRVKRLFQKLWPLLYKRAKLDLRSTKWFT